MWKLRIENEDYMKFEFEFGSLNIALAFVEEVIRHIVSKEIKFSINYEEEEE